MIGDDNAILVLNAGSSSIKAALYDTDLSCQMQGAATGIGDDATGEIKLSGQTRSASLPTHDTALAALFAAFADHGLDLSRLRAVAHRVVHGGANLTQPQIITDDLRTKIADCIPLAPLHNPHNLAAIDAVSRLAPTLQQCASFDTAFHATNPDIATRYAIPDTQATKGIRRYGFHGISYAAMVQNWKEVTQTALPERLLAFHLGNGASACAILKGQSVATTMGYSPLDGLTMGTRCGSIDAGAVLHLAQTLGIEDTRILLNNKSGLLGLSEQSSDMRSLETGETANATFAIDHFCYWAARHGGSLIAALGGVDAIAFTGGIGENSSRVRDKIISHLSWSGINTAQIIPAREERQIAADAIALLSQK